MSAATAAVAATIIESGANKGLKFRLPGEATPGRKALINDDRKNGSQMSSKEGERGGRGAIFRAASHKRRRRSRIGSEGAGGTVEGKREKIEKGRFSFSSFRPRICHLSAAICFLKGKKES
jgi:hypothetical protein